MPDKLFVNFDRNILFRAHYSTPKNEKMKRNLKFLALVALVVSMFSSCKKTTDLSIITGHKWALTAYTETYSDSPGVSHNLMPVDTPCQNSSYTQFYNYTTNSSVRDAYTYLTTNCPGQISTPDVAITTWNIDPDNTVLFWQQNTYNISSISSSSMALTITGQSELFPITTPVSYHTVTDTWTYSAQ